MNVLAAFNASLDVMRGLGATIVEPADFPDAEELLVSRNASTVLSVDLKLRMHHARFQTRDEPC